jgi:drug/metabolite transporter (DMT)-like permease
LRGYLFVVISAIAFGTMPLWATQIYAEGVNSLSLVFLRSFCSFPILALLAKKQASSLRVPKKALHHIILMSIFGAFLTPFLLFLSYRYIPSGTATVFHFIYPAMVVLGSILFLKEKVKKMDLISVFICIVGISLFYTPGTPLDFRGALIALLSGCTWATYILMLSHFPFKNLSGFLFSFILSSFGIAINFLLCIVTSSLTFPKTIKGWVLCFLFSILINIVAIVLFQQGTFAIGGTTSSVLSTLEPITSIVLGALFLHEKVSLQTAIGSILVLSASVIIAMKDLKKEKNQ